MMQALDGLWDKICENVRRGISPDAFQRWFAPARLVETGEDTLTLAVPNSIQQLWIESNYATLLQDAIILTLGDRRAVKFRVEMTAPLISRVPEMAGGGVGGGCGVHGRLSLHLTAKVANPWACQRRSRRSHAG